MLLAAVVTVFAIQGIAEPARWEQVLVTAVLGLTLMLALCVAEARAQLMAAAGTLALAVLVLSFVEAISGQLNNGAMRLANALLVAVGTPMIMLGVVRSIRSRRTVSLEAVLGVLSVYLMLGMFFALVYGAVARLGGGSFFAQGASATVPRCLYFSFTSLTTVGYGDLTARSNLGHTLSISEALLGQIYLVTIVSLLVANLGRGPNRGGARPLPRDREYPEDPRRHSPEG
jgi:Ion channel